MSLSSVADAKRSRVFFRPSSDKTCVDVGRVALVKSVDASCSSRSKRARTLCSRVMSALPSDLACSCVQNEKNIRNRSQHYE